MKFEILGPGCTNCDRLMALTEEVVRELGVPDAEVTKIADLSEITAKGVMLTPALAVDGRVVTSGRVPGKAELTTLITTVLCES